MTDRRRLIGGVVIATVIVIGVLAAANTRRPARSPDPSVEPSAVASIGTSASGTPGSTTADPSASAGASDPEPAPTPRARTSGDPRLAYAEFLLRANDDRSTVETMNAALTKGVDERDRPAVSKASGDILDFVGTEREWLRTHPPSACYEDAHGAAGSMLKAYGTAADRFIAWTKAAQGLDSLVAIGRALEAANTAGEGLTAFGRALEKTSCR